MSELSFKYEAFHSSYKDITWTYIYYDKAKEAMLRMNSSYHRKLYSISDILTLKYGEWKVCYICKIRGHTLKCFKNFRSIFEVTTTYIYVHNPFAFMLLLSLFLCHSIICECSERTECPSGDRLLCWTKNICFYIECFQT